MHLVKIIAGSYREYFHEEYFLRRNKMAGADYLMCGECGKRLCYDGKKTIRLALEWQPIFCEKCWVKLKKKIAVLEKHDRRKQ